MHKPFLIGQKIYLREIEETDLNDNYQQWLNDEEICKFNSHHRFPNYKQNMNEYYENVIKSRNNLILAIIDKATDKHIGNISLQEIDQLNNTAEFAIIIGDKDFWSKGIGKEVSLIIVNHGFKELNLNRIYCGTSEDNIGMQKLAEKIGFVKEGISRKTLYKNGKYRNVINYGLLRNEYKQ